METETAAPDGERLFGGAAGTVLLILSLGTGLFTLGRQLAPPLLPAIIADLGITSFEAGIALTVMSIATAACQYPGGRLSDRLSRETMVFGALGVFIAGALILGVTPGFGGFLLGFAIVGAGNGFYTPAARAKISDLYVDRRGQAFGFNMSFLDLGGVTAAGLAVAILALSTWRMGFLLIAALAALLVVPVHRLDRERFTLDGFELDLVETGRRVFSTPWLKSVIFTYSLFLFTYRAVVGFLPLFLQAERGFSPALAAGSFAILFGMGIATKPLAGGLSDRYPRPVVGVGSVLVSCIGLVVLLVSRGELPILAGVVVLAAGQKAFFPPMEAHLLDNFEVGSMGGDLGAIRTVYLAVASFGPVYVGYVAVTASYTVAFAGLLVVLLAGAGSLLVDVIASS